MRLLCCPRCRAQYDVALRGGRPFHCHCGERIEPPDESGPQRPVERAAQRCGACGALLPARAEHCEYCRAQLPRDRSQLGPICPQCYARSPEGSRFCVSCGCEFAPQPIPDELREWPCPCCGALMPAKAVAGLALNECASCGGLWVPEDRLQQLIQRAVDARRNRELPPLARGPHPVANPAARPLAYRKCPVCEAFMLRRNYAQRSGIILDVCTAHGSWLDADELERIGAFILSGGLEQAQAREREQRAEQERRQRQDRALAEAGMRGYAEPEREPRSGWVLELLRSLLG
jgi:Zn-finger nucleic acid-binding protein